MTDPRFDPAFQRGYSGPEPELVVRQVAPRHQTAPDVESRVVAEIPVTEIPAAENVSSPPHTVADAPTEENLSPTRRNPFALAMLVGGLIMIVIGVAMVWSVAAQNNSYVQSSLDTGAQALAILNYLLPPALLLGGILGVLGWLILGALGAPRRPDGTP